MQTTYVEPITFNNAPITTGGSCRTVHRIERGVEFATNLRIVNINFACTKSDGTGALTNLPLVAPLGICEGISELRLETLDGTLIDSIQNAQLLALLLNQRAPNAVLEGMGMVAGVGSYMTVNNSLNLQTMPRSFNSGLLLNASGYSLDLRKWFDFLNAVPAMNSGINIVIVWGNSFSRAGNNLVRLANTPLLAYDYVEGLYEKSVKENIQYTAYITDRLSVPAGTNATQLQEMSMNVYSLKDKFIDCLLYVVCDATTNLPVLQQKQQYNQTINGVQQFFAGATTGIGEAQQYKQILDTALIGGNMSFPINHVRKLQCDSVATGDYKLDDATLADCLATYSQLNVIGSNVYGRINTHIIRYIRQNIAGDATTYNALNLNMFAKVRKVASFDGQGRLVEAFA